MFDFRGLVPALLFLGGLIGVATTVAGWALWRFVLSHIDITWR